MGTPPFAVCSLKALRERGFDIKAVVTQPDKERGRGRKVSFTPVKEAALEMGIPVLQPVSMKDPQFINTLKELKASLFVVVAFRILPQSVLDIPFLGSVNLHASLLPQYRGAAPINHALFNGEKETGVTVFFLNRGVDTGSIISSETVAIDDGDDYGTLYEKLAVRGAGLLADTAQNIFDGNYSARPQEKGAFPVAPKIGPADFVIDWTLDAESIRNRVRGLSPKPGACAALNGVRIKILSAASDSATCDAEPGTVIEADCKKGILRVAAGKGSLIITKVQPESKAATDARCFLNGHRIVPGTRFDKSF
ncbi:MAG: methionyl-tRNA formyltransferase [Candidatus Delongbacteria bacterium]|jgi:methionyl-tRNA formyltransferase|nr:methionyl-tRNA formyltransferase [Candidatus Delongbacteria bacterium]